MRLLTRNIHTFIDEQEWPKGFEYRKLDKGEFVRIQLYRLNINSFDADDKLQLAKVLNETLWAIRNNGVPIYIEVVPGFGRDYDDYGQPIQP